MKKSLFAAALLSLALAACGGADKAADTAASAASNAMDAAASAADAAASAADADMGVVGGECLQDVVDGTGGGHAAALGGRYHAVGEEIG